MRQDTKNPAVCDPGSWQYEKFIFHGEFLQLSDPTAQTHPEKIWPDRAAFSPAVRTHSELTEKSAGSVTSLGDGLLNGRVGGDSREIGHRIRESLLLDPAHHLDALRIVRIIVQQRCADPERKRERRIAVFAGRQRGANQPVRRPELAQRLPAYPFHPDRRGRDSRNGR